ncbi:sialin-like isoform X2 [Dysidea avara]
MELAALTECETLSHLKRRIKTTRQAPKCWYMRCLPCVKARYVLTVMLSLGICIAAALRVNLSVAIVQMTAKNPHHSQRSFHWSNSEQGWILSSFFYGYILTQIPGGWLATKFGGKYVFGIGVLVTSLLTLITPQMAYLNLWALVACRIAVGTVTGLLLPAMNAMFGKWAPPLERSMMATIGLSGTYAGNIVGFPLSGMLCNTMGWPWAFYLSGFVGIIWFVAWLILVFNTPADHPRISPEERRYIETSIDTELLLQNSTTSKEDLPPPWRAMFTSPAVLAVVIGHFTNNWGFYTLLICLPTFLNQTLCLDIKRNGLYSAIPYTCLAVLSILWGQVTDMLRQRELVNTTVIRKFNSTLGLCLPAMFLLLCGFYGSTTGWAVTFLTLSVGSAGFAAAGYHVNYLDISPKYAGIVIGISNTIATIPGLVAPQVAKVIAKEPSFKTCNDSCEDPTSIDVYQQEWTLVFIIAAEIYVFGAIAYLLLASGEKQWWADGVQATNKRDIQAPSSPMYLQPLSSTTDSDL